MLSKFEFHPNAEMKSTSTLAFDIGNTYTNKRSIKYPLEFEYNRSVENRSKMERVGSWPGFNYVRSILVHVAFDIFDETSTGFNANREAIYNSFVPANPTAVETIQALGALYLRFDGDSEDIRADVTLNGDISMPISGPNYSDCTMTLEVPAGYFTGVTTPANIYYPK
jgi:hypothetical protein